MISNRPDKAEELPGRHSSLRVRVGLLVGGAMLVMLTCSFFVTSWALKSYFGRLQDELTAARLQQVAIIVNKEARAQVRLVQNDAEWDEAWDFLKGTNPQFLERNYSLPANSSGQPVVLVFDQDRKLTGAVHTSGEESIYLPPDGLNVATLAQSRLLGDGPAAGLAKDEKGVLLLTSAPITRSDSEKPSNGWLVFGSYLTEESLTEMGSMAGAETSFKEHILNGEIPRDVRVEFQTELLGMASLEFPSVFVTGTEMQKVAAKINFTSLSDQPAISLHVLAPITVYRDAHSIVKWMITLGIAGRLIVILVVLLAIEFVVIRPLGELDRGLRRMAVDGKSDQLPPSNRTDEIGRLSRSANALFQTVAKGRNEAEQHRVLLATVLNSTTEGVVAFRAIRNEVGKIADLEFVLVNHAAEIILRFQADEVIGKRVRELYPQLVESGLYDRWVRATETGQPTSFESFYEGNRVSGWFHNSVGVWEDGIVVTVRNITERKQREEELAESYAEMDRFNAAMIGREERIISMKKEVNELRTKLGQPPLYEVSDDEW